MMQKETGDPTFPLWLLGDSNPKHWETVLSTPLDPRHPARHSIWTPVLDVIQDRVYREARLRVDARSLYIRNAIEDPDGKPRGNDIAWGDGVESEIIQLDEAIAEFAPHFVFSFGAFAYEFARRSMHQQPKRTYSYWGARRLGEDFRERIDGFDPTKANIVPLLHVSIARGRFIQSHDYFCDEQGANYFDYTGNLIAETFLKYRDSLDIWIE